MSFKENKLTTRVVGNYKDNLPLANVTIAGLVGRPNALLLTLDGVSEPTSDAVFTYSGNGTLYITNLMQATRSGVWNGDLTMQLK